MCGIAGIFSLNSKLNPSWIKQMTKSMAHRGPDADGNFVSENEKLALGHRRLSIVDLSAAAHQPMFSHCGRYVMVFNGEIYNYKELAAKHKIKANTSSDSEVVLELFVLLGKDFVNELNGMFALSIYDKKEEKLWLFRDRVGIKPLYFYWKNETLIFASELKAIKQLKEEFALSINKKAIYNYLRLGYIPEPMSIFNEVRKFPAGSLMSINADGYKIESYWKLKDKIKKEQFTDEKSAKKELDDLLKSSVNYRMMADVPFGTFLSGGIDSSTVTALAQNISETPINTFSIGFKESSYNEAKFAKEIATYLGTNHHEFMVSYNEAIEHFDSILKAYDEPFADSSAIPTMLVSKLARQHVTMTLSGDGGDEQFLGYGMYNWAKRLNNPLIKLFGKPLRYAFSKSNQRHKRASDMFGYTEDATLPSHIFSVEQYFFTDNDLKNILNPDSIFALDLNETEGKDLGLNAQENQAFFDINHYLKDDLLVKVDRASMQYSLETRVPLLDHRVLEYSVNLSSDLKIKNSESKYLLKQVLYDYVPKKYFDRPKWGFSIPIRFWLQNELKYLPDKYLSENVLAKYGIFNIAQVKEIERRYFAGEDYLFNKIWAIILLNQWLENN
ncbi:MAG: asparagine synthase (glutamine-hydrolyzing) [Chitinophagales bacterium]